MSRARDLPRERRDGWAARQRPKLVKRDIAILYAIGRCKVLRTRDIARLFFGSRATANDRLRKLFVAKLIDCHVPNLAGDNLYTLTERGRQVVAEATDGDASQLTVPRALPQRLEHLAGINELRILLTLATASPASPFRLTAFRPEWELAAERHASLIGILPDALFTLEARGGDEHHFALEMDCGTESPTIVAKKLVRYDTYARSSLPLYGVDVRTVLVAASGARRLRCLARAISPLALLVRVRFGDVQALTPAGLFDEFASLATVMGTRQE